MSLASYHCSTPGSVELLRRGLRLAAAVSLKGSRRCELAELVADHVFRHVQAHELPSVMNEERRADELRDDGAVARPRLDRFPIVRALIAVNPRHQPLINVRPFFQRPAHLIHSAGSENYRSFRAIVQCLTQLA